MAHHYKQWLPISELPTLHGAIRDEIKVPVPTYWTFYRQILAAVAGRPASPGADEADVARRTLFLDGVL